MASVSEHCNWCLQPRDNICIREHANVKHVVCTCVCVCVSVCVCVLCAGWADSAALPVEEPEKLTELGRKLTQYPVLPRLGVMLVKAMELGVLVPVVAVVAALSVQVSGSVYGGVPKFWTH